jgi:Zn-dependent protease
VSSALERLRQLENSSKPPSHGPEPGRARKGVIASIVAALSLLLVKGKAFAVLVLSKLQVILAFAGKFFATGWSMLLMGWTYSWFYGWPFALGLVGLILIHEIGHGLAARRAGMRIGAPMFVPFVGAYIAIRSKFQTRFDEFYVAAGGPLVGGLASLACIGASFAFEAGILRVLGFFGLVMNLFNLTPFWTLDGARMLAIVRPSHGVLGVVAAALVVIPTAIVGGHLNVFGALALALAAFKLGHAAWRGRRPRAPGSVLARVEALEAKQAAPDDDVPVTKRIAATVTYFAMLAGYTAAVQLLFPLMPAAK